MALLRLDNPVLCIVGPTSSGKSELAQTVAQQLHGEIVSADSMQIYRGMDIGTGKVVPEDQRVAHHGIDLIDPGEPYSAQLFQDYARNLFRSIDARGSIPILCGGTGFYVRAALDDYHFPEGDQVDNPVRRRYTALLESKGSQAVWDVLEELDPQSAASIHPNNSKRVIRALELNAQGLSYAEQVEKLHQIEQCVPAVFIGLRVDREILYQRINARVDSMVEKGLVEEVRKLLEKGFRDGITAPQAIGYKEIVRAIDGTCSLDDAIEEIKQSTRRYAKRQISWFKNDSRIHWLDATNPDYELLAEEANIIYRNSIKGDAPQEQ